CRHEVPAAPVARRGVGPSRDVGIGRAMGLGALPCPGGRIDHEPEAEAWRPRSLTAGDRAADGARAADTGTARSPVLAPGRYPPSEGVLRGQAVADRGIGHSADYPTQRFRLKRPARPGKDTPRGKGLGERAER